MSAGERLATLAGPTAVLGIQPQQAPQTVYNLEVQGQHVFRVTSNGLLVHNMCAPRGVITGKLSREASDVFRTQARDIWQATTGRRAIWDNLQVHHRIPLEWSHIFGKADPNRLSNLVGINSRAHSQVTNAWNAWKRSLNGRTPTQAEVLEQALRIDGLFKGSWVFPK